MKLFGISDLHLSFGTNKPMNIFGGTWENYEEKIRKNWLEQVSNDDFVIIAGDISWGINFEESLEDFKFINDLPGKKILLRGNHDYYFSTKTKMEKFFKENNLDTLSYLYNNAMDTDKYIICGTRGWGKTENSNLEDSKRIVEREKIRIRLSLEEGKKIQEKYLEQGIKKEILFAIHFPPFEYDFVNILKEYNVKKCIYGHLHGFGHTTVKEGLIDNIEYIMVGCDYTKFKLIEL